MKNSRTSGWFARRCLCEKIPRANRHYPGASCPLRGSCQSRDARKRVKPGRRPVVTVSPRKPARKSISYRDVQLLFFFFPPALFIAQRGLKADRCFRNGKINRRSAFNPSMFAASRRKAREIRKWSRRRGILPLRFQIRFPLRDCFSTIFPKIRPRIFAEASSLHACGWNFLQTHVASYLSASVSLVGATRCLGLNIRRIMPDVKHYVVFLLGLNHFLQRFVRDLSRSDVVWEH